MASNKLIRLENLKRLGLSPADLVVKVGSSKQFWSDLLRGQKSFGEGLARKIEERLELSSLWLDAVESTTQLPPPNGREENHAGSAVTVTANESKRSQNPLGQTNPTTDQEIPTEMVYEPRHLRSAILLMGNLLGVLDKRSKKYVGELLQEMALVSDDFEEIEDIAEKASSFAKVQKPLTKNKSLNKAMQGRGVAVETGPAPLGEK